MAKFYGQVGFVKSAEVEGTGKWVDTAFERDCYGDVSRIVRKWEGGQKVNDDITINNEISILSDPFVTENLPWIKYVRWNGAVWKVTTVEVQYPRLVLSIGGVYNGKQVESSSNP